jgi:hypothetical protein
MKVDVGLLLPSREVLLWADSDLHYLVDAAVEAERIGFGSIWVGDSLLARPAASRWRAAGGFRRRDPTDQTRHGGASPDAAAPRPARARARHSRPRVARPKASDVTAAVYLTLAVATDRQRAAEEFDAYIRAYYGVPGELMARLQASQAGTLDSARDWISGYVDAGAEQVILRLAHPTPGGYLQTASELLAVIR